MLDTESAVPDADDMTLITAPELLNYVDVAHSTKDSIQVVWSLSADIASTVIRGFKVRYQAVGSTVIQYSHMLSPTASSHDIIRLHENTAYEICVRAFTTLHSGLAIIPRTTTSSTPDDVSGSSSIISGRRSGVDTSFSLGCVTGSTAIDALRVAVGSTLGAFIALGIVVAFVLLAKCQHRRRYGRGGGGGRRAGAGRGKMQRLTDSEEASLDDDDEEEEEEEEDDCVDCVDRRAELESNAVGVGRTPKMANCGETRGRWETAEKETVIAGNGILPPPRQPPIYVDVGQSGELRDVPDWCQTAGQRVTFYDVSPAAQPSFSFELVAEKTTNVDPAEEVSSLYPVWQLQQDVDQTTGCGLNHVGRMTQPPIVGSRVQPQQLQQRVQLFPVAQQLLIGRSFPNLMTPTPGCGGSDVPAEGDAGMIYVGGQFDGCYPTQNDDSAADWHDTARLLTTTNGREHNFIGGSLRQNHSSLW